MAEQPHKQGTGIDVSVDVRPALRKLEAAGRAFDPAPLLKHIGQTLLFWVNRNFEQHGALFGSWPALRPNTLANPRRGGTGSQPLRSSERLAKSFTAYGVQVLGLTAVRVGTKVLYAAHHQYGTGPYTITPRNKKVLFFWTVGGNAGSVKTEYRLRGNTFARVVYHRACRSAACCRTRSWRVSMLLTLWRLSSWPS